MQKEKIYTIPVNDAFDSDAECPICVMRKALETNAIDFTMGPSYMEGDIREVTSRMGFCEKHVEQLYQHQNRLGLALILKTHMDKIINDIEKLSGADSKFNAPSLFKKKSEKSAVITYLDQLEETCYVCDKIENTYERYMDTIFYLYHREENFRIKLNKSKGFCTNHYKALYAAAPQHLKGEELNEFVKILNELYLSNMKRVRDELEWFVDKFDYRYTNEPWKNSKDALPRSMQKTNSINGGI